MVVLSAACAVGLALWTVRTAALDAALPPEGAAQTNP
jgi:hypothetical protein